MNNSFARLIDGMNATLRKEVLTRLDDEFARGQVFGVINLLNTFKVRADWSAGFLLERGVIRFLYGRPLETLLLTWGVSLMIQQGLRLWFGAANVDVTSPRWLSGGIPVMIVALVSRPASKHAIVALTVSVE